MGNFEKKYKEVLRKATKIYRDDDERIKHYMEVLFPELKDEDEKIREKLIENFKWFCGDYLNTTKWGKDDMLVKDIIIWLEKQGNKYVNIDIESMVSSYEQRLKSQGQGNLENNPLISQQDEYELVAKKVEPKFKVGDWIACEELNNAKIISIDNDRYEVKFIDGTKGFPHIDFIDRNFHLWTIADAKDGDVLVSACNQSFIYNGKYNSSNVGAYCGINRIIEKFIVSQGILCWTERNGVKPANKEQRDLLFEKMKEAGYMWDAKKKELKQIEQKSHLNEDEKLTDDCNFQYITDMIERYSKYCWDDEFSNNILNWFKSLKNRIK